MAELLVEEVISLVDQADGDVCDHLWRAGLDEFAVEIEGLRRLSSEPAHELCLLGVLVPNRVLAHAKVIAVIGQKFFEAGPADTRKLNLRLLGSERGLAAFEDVLFPGARRLNHLVYRAVASGEILVREAEGEVINDLSFLVGEQCLVIATRRDDRPVRRALMGVMGSMCPIAPMLPILPIVFHSSALM